MKIFSVFLAMFSFKPQVSSYITKLEFTCKHALVLGI